MTWRTQLFSLFCITCILLPQCFAKIATASRPDSNRMSKFPKKASEVVIPKHLQKLMEDPVLTFKVKQILDSLPAPTQEKVGRISLQIFMYLAWVQAV